MRSLAVGCFALTLAGACLAQQWQLGASGGIGFYRNVTVERSGQSAQAGFKLGPAFSVFAGQDLYEHLGGQFRYTLQLSDLKVSSGGQEATLRGQSHAVHYDLLFLGGKRGAAVRPFIAAGSGVKMYRGTGAPHESQALGQFVALTHTADVKALITFGGGVRIKLGKRGCLHVEARDYLTRFPTQVVTPVPPSKLSGWLHDIVPMLGLSIGF
jgi:hypothetical protein